MPQTGGDHRGKGGRNKKAIDSASGKEEDNRIGYINTVLEYYLHINPNDLTDEEWAEKMAQIADIREREAKANK